MNVTLIVRVGVYPMAPPPGTGKLKDPVGGVTSPGHGPLGAVVVVAAEVVVVANGSVVVVVANVVVVVANVVVVVGASVVVVVGTRVVVVAWETVPGL